MAKRLNDKEKLVLYNMVKSPTSSDRELSERTDIKLSTVTAIRLRLRERRFFRTVRIPCVQSIGGEMLSISYFYYKATIPMNIRLITGNKLAKDHKEVFWTGSEYTQAVSLQLSRNLTDARKNIADIEALYTAQGFMDEGGLTFLTFPFEISRIPLFFDFEPILRQTFGFGEVPGDLASKAGYPTHGSPARLTKTANKVYMALVESPELTDTALAKKMSVSQRTVTKLRNRFEETGMMRTAIVPNLGMLGFEMLVFDHAKLNLHIQDKQRLEIMGVLTRIKPPIFLAMGSNDIAALTAYESFDTYRRCINEFSEVYRHDDIYTKEPKRLTFSLNEMRMLKEHVYGPIVGKMLGI